MRPLLWCPLLLVVPATLPAQLRAPVDKSAIVNRMVTATASAGGVSQSAVQVSWTPVTNATEYRVLHGLDPNGPFAMAGVVAGGSTTFLDQGLVPGTGFYYRIEAYGSSPQIRTVVQASGPLAVLTASAGTLGASAPQNVRCTWNGNSCNITWDPVPGATGYAYWTKKMSVSPLGCFYMDRNTLPWNSMPFTRSTGPGCADSFQFAAYFVMANFPTPGAVYRVDGPRATFDP